MHQQTITTVNIFGKEYPISSDQNPEYIRRLADYVDRKMNEIASNAESAPLGRIAVLACLNISDDLIRMKSEKEKFIRLVEGRITNMIKILDKKLEV